MLYDSVSLFLAKLERFISITVCQISNFWIANYEFKVRFVNCNYKISDQYGGHLFFKIEFISYVELLIKNIHSMCVRKISKTYFAKKCKIFIISQLNEKRSLLAFYNK